jgi:hypothetical protein
MEVKIVGVPCLVLEVDTQVIALSGTDDRCRNGAVVRPRFEIDPAGDLDE